MGKSISFAAKNALKLLELLSLRLICLRLRIQFTALFTNMRILKFKSQLMIVLFAAVNHLNRPFRKQNFTLTGSKGHGF